MLFLLIHLIYASYFLTSYVTPSFWLFESDKCWKNEKIAKIWISSEWKELLGKIGKYTGFRSLRINCREINQVTSKMDFWDKTCKKGPKQKKEHNINWQFWTFGPNLPKQKKWKVILNYVFSIRLDLRLQLEQTILIFCNKFALKSILPFKSRKCEHQIEFKLKSSNIRKNPLNIEIEILLNSSYFS